MWKRTNFTVFPVSWLNAIVYEKFWDRFYCKFPTNYYFLKGCTLVSGNTKKNIFFDPLMYSGISQSYPIIKSQCTSLGSRSKWPRDLRCRFAATRLLGFRVRIPSTTWMSVCCEFCAGRPSRVLPSVLCLSVIVTLQQRGYACPLGAVEPWKKDMVEECTCNTPGNG